MYKSKGAFPFSFLATTFNLNGANDVRTAYRKFKIIII